MNVMTTRWNRGAMRLFGAGVFIALAGTAMLTAEAAPMDGGGHRHGGGLMGGQFSERMLDAVSASTEQRSQVKQILEVARADLKAQREAGRALHDQMRQLFTQPTVDARTAETLRLQQLAQHDTASKRMMQVMLDVSRVLSPEQRAKLAELGAQRRGRMERGGPPPK